MSKGFVGKIQQLRGKAANINFSNFIKELSPKSESPSKNKSSPKNKTPLKSKSRKRIAAAQSYGNENNSSSKSKGGRKTRRHKKIIT